MKKVLLLLLSILLIVYSCTNNKYTYIETSKDSFGNEKRGDAKIIQAENDLDAYIEAFKNFCISQRVSLEMKKKGLEDVPSPLRFEVWKGEKTQIEAQLPNDLKDSIINLVGGIKSEISTSKEDNEVGEWEVQYFVDEFGEPTEKGYVSIFVKGTFSNSATENSDLVAHFIVVDKKDIAIKLYEYARNNPVKDSKENTIYVLDKNKNKHTLSGYNYSDRISLSDTGKKCDAEKLYNILIQGGEVKFRIVEDNYTTSIYNFKVNANGFGDIIEKLNTSKK